MSLNSSLRAQMCASFMGQFWPDPLPDTTISSVLAGTEH